VLMQSLNPFSHVPGRTAGLSKRVRLIRVPWLLPGWAQAQVWGRYILIRRGVPLTLNLLAHELAHVQQWQRLGVARFIWHYAKGLVRHGYWRHPLEEEARAAEHQPSYRDWAGEILNALKESAKKGNPRSCRRSRKREK
jgi:hypothetical protein